MPRFSIASFLIGVTVSAVLIALNVREIRSTPERLYAPLEGGTPALQLRMLATAVHHDHGWPVWHTRATTYTEVEMEQPEEWLGASFGNIAFAQRPMRTDWMRAGFDFVVSLSAVIFGMIACEFVIRRSRGPARDGSSAAPPQDLEHAITNDSGNPANGSEQPHHGSLF